jgi:hypothetical protein
VRQKGVLHLYGWEAASLPECSRMSFRANITASGSSWKSRST